MKALQIKSNNQFELVNITEQIKKKIDIDSGLCIIFVPHTTAGIICNENEPNLKTDILNLAKQFKASHNFTHDPGEGPASTSPNEVRRGGNAHGHIINSLAGGARTFIIENGQLQMGTWQSIMFLEMDGPRERKIFIKTISNS